MKPKHLLTGKELNSSEIQHIINLAIDIKSNPKQYKEALRDKTLVMLFEKPSFRTRLSFSGAIQKMGGNIIESVGSTRKSEEPKDTIQVLNGYCDIVMLRTHEDLIFDEMAQFASIPIINGLSELYHPCQVMADMMSLYETFGKLDGLTLAFTGDGNNVLNSLILMLPVMGAKVHYACPKGREPKAITFPEVQKEFIHGFDNAQAAVEGASAIYTDVWTSMGFEGSVQNSQFEEFQVNDALMSRAKQGSVFMHCMPMVRGQEVTDSVADSKASIIYRQAENRLYIQQAIMLFLLEL